MKLNPNDFDHRLDSHGSTPSSHCFPKRRSDLSTRSTEGEKLILDREGGVIHQLNSTASMIWELCDGRTSVEEMVSRIVEAFDVDKTVVDADVKKTLIEFGTLNLLEKKLERDRA